MPSDPAEGLTLWRYHLIAEALDPKLASRERGLLVRQIAGEHATPGGDPRQVSRNTLDRWIRRYRPEGLAGLRDRPRSDHGSARVSPALLNEAIRLRLEVPARSAAHISEIVRLRHGVRVAERTLAEQFRRRGFTRGELLRDARTFGRYEADAPNERWVGDVLVGPSCPTRRRRARSGPACSCSSTTTAASSSPGAGSATRPCGPARRCSARRSCGAACRSPCTSTTAARTAMPSSPGVARSSASGSSTAVPARRRGGVSRSASTGSSGNASCTRGRDGRDRLTR
jgi:transposase